jgi:hypothetical protein
MDCHFTRKSDWLPFERVFEHVPPSPHLKSIRAHMPPLRPYTSERASRAVASESASPFPSSRLRACVSSGHVEKGHWRPPRAESIKLDLNAVQKPSDGILHAPLLPWSVASRLTQAYTGWHRLPHARLRDAYWTKSNNLRSRDGGTPSQP